MRDTDGVVLDTKAECDMPAAIKKMDKKGGQAREAASLETIVRALEEDIVLGRLHPRERLIEEELLDRFGATRHTIRLALMELDRMGLVERIPNRGAQVRSYSIAEINQLYALRELLETEAARLIPLPLPQAYLEEIEAIQVTHDAAVAALDFAAIYRSNHAFHHKLFACCGNAFLINAIDAASDRANGIRFLALASPVEVERVRRQHHEIIDCLRTGDREALVRLCRVRLPASKDIYLRAYASILPSGST